MGGTIEDMTSLTDKPVDQSQQSIQNVLQQNSHMQLHTNMSERSLDLSHLSAMEFDKGLPNM